MSTRDDHRLYVPRLDEWSLRVMTSHGREYCHAKFPGEMHYHMLVGGEAYLDNGEQKYCLECGHRLGLVTGNRMFWQKERAADVPPPKPGETGLLE